MTPPRSYPSLPDPIDIAALRPPFAPRDAASAWLYRLHRLGIRPGLDSIRELLARMGDPHRACGAVVVAGTNGKGSAATALAHQLRHAGLRVGLYTSPHFLSIHERIRVQDQPVSEAELFSLVSENRGLLERCGTTFFESLTALAFEHFRRQECEVLVLEAGLGGRLDATNVADKLGVLITSIGLDHQELLGRTEEAIAGEKLGLVESGVPLYLMSAAEPLRRLAQARAAAAGSELIELETSAVAVPSTLRSSRLRGSYRRVARLAQNLCRRMDWPAPDTDAAATDYRLSGRFDRRGLNPELLLDSAHNAHALVPLLREWGESAPHREGSVLVLSATEGKELTGVAEAALAVASHILCVAPGWPRAVAPEVLAQQISASQHGAAGFECAIEAAASVRAGLERARELAQAAQGRVLVTGSNFLVAEALDRLGFDALEDPEPQLWGQGRPLRTRSATAEIG